MRPVRNWIDLLSVLGLFVGIALVILQLRQNEELIRFQIATELRVNQDANRSAIRGERFSSTLIKVQTAPEELTDAELLEFDAHARSIVSELDFRRSLAAAGIFKGDWTRWLESETCTSLDNSVGHTWLEVQRKTGDPAIDHQMLDELEQRLGECAGRTSFLKTVRESQADL